MLVEKGKLSTNSKFLPYFRRKIKCPNTFILKPGAKGFMVEPNSLEGKFSGADLQSFGKHMGCGTLKNWRFKRDRFGRKIPNWNDYFQPEVTAAYAIEHIYDPLNPVCGGQCKGRCLEGTGQLGAKGIKRIGT